MKIPAQQTGNPLAACYCSQLDKALSEVNYAKPLKRQFLSQMQDSLCNYLEAHPDARLEDLYAAFGTPQEAADSVLLNTDSAQIKKQQERIAMLEEEMEAILMERIRDKANAERYNRMIQKREAEIATAQKQIEELQNIEETLRNRQAKLKRDISMMDDILKEGHLSEAHLRLLVDKIYVHEENGKLSLDICLKAPFRDHMDIYENGEQTECYLSQSYDFERLGPIIMKDFWENG